MTLRPNHYALYKSTVFIITVFKKIINTFAALASALYKLIVFKVSKNRSMSKHPSTFG